MITTIQYIPNPCIVHNTPILSLYHVYIAAYIQCTVYLYSNAIQTRHLAISMHGIYVQCLYTVFTIQTISVYNVSQSRSIYLDMVDILFVFLLYFYFSLTLLECPHLDLFCKKSLKKKGKPGRLFHAFLCNCHPWELTAEPWCSALSLLHGELADSI